MSLFWTYFQLSAPLFGIVLAGYVLAKWRKWRHAWTAMMTKAVFAFILPAFLFRLMSKLQQLPPVDPRVLLAFFGSCLLVFLFGYWVAKRIFKRDGVAASVFGLGGVFSNNVLLGIPLTRMTLGEAAMPAVALVLVFNALTLWTLLSVAVEWSRHGSFSVQGIARTGLAVSRNPIVLSIVGGAAFGWLGFELPAPVAAVLDGISGLAGPVSLLVLGMGLANYSLRHGWHESVTICGIKLLVQPATVWFLAWSIGLGPVERSAVVLLASVAVGANVYLMSAQYETMQGSIASSIVMSTFLAAFTTPIFLALMSAVG